MSIVVSACGETVTIYANSAAIKVSVAEAFQLQAHLKYALEELMEEQVVQVRRNLIGGTYYE